jgi:hypothetical protein
VEGRVLATGTEPEPTTAQPETAPSQRPEATASDTQGENRIQTESRRSRDQPQDEKTLAEIQVDLVRLQNEQLKLKLQLEREKREERERQQANRKRKNLSKEEKEKLEKEEAEAFATEQRAKLKATTDKFVAEAVPLGKVAKLREAVKQDLTLKGLSPKPDFPSSRTRAKGKEKEEEITDLTQEDSDSVPVSQLSERSEKRPKVTFSPDTPGVVSSPVSQPGPSSSDHIPAAAVASAGTYPQATFVTPNPVIKHLRGKAERWEDIGSLVEFLKRQFVVQSEGKSTDLQKGQFETLTPLQKELGTSLTAYKTAVRVERVNSNFHTTAYNSTEEYYSRVGHYSQPGLPTGVTDKSPHSWAETALVELNASWLAQANLQIGLLKRIVDNRIAAEYETIIVKLIPVLEKLVNRCWATLNRVQASTIQRPVRFPPQPELSVSTEALWLGEGLILAVQSLLNK